MKHTLMALVCLLLSCISLSAEIRIAGKFKHPVSDSIYLETEDGIPVTTVFNDRKKGFAITFNGQDGFYYIGDGNEHTQIWLQNGYDLYLTLNTKHFDETIEWKGSGAAENNYLAKRLLLEEYTETLGSIWKFVKRDEIGFLRYCDSMKTMSGDLYNQFSSGMSPAFALREKCRLDLAHRSRLYDYINMHAYITGKKDFKVSEQFPDPFSGFDPNMENMIGIWEYEDILSSYLSFKAQNSKNKDYYTAYLSYMEQEIRSAALREMLAYKFGSYSISYAHNLDTCYDIAIRNIRDTTKLAEVRSKYEKLKKLKKGMPSPPFAFADRDGKIHTLESLKGKIVYIDIWATWCGPCREENPYWEKLQDSLKNTDIVFVSICYSDDRSNWQNYLNKKQPLGLHLFAENRLDPFFTDYVIQGVPTYILIDRNGNIINAKAYRPSQPDTLSNLRLLLNEQ